MNSLRPSAGLAGALLLLASLPYAGFHLLAQAELRSPFGLGAGALALPLIALHMLRVQLPRRVVGSLLLWRQAVPQPNGARPFQALRRNLPLFLQLLALGALTYALAGPVVGGFSVGSAPQVVVLDLSASMGASDEPGGATRLERARAQALALLADLDAGAEATVIAVDRTAEVLCPWTDDSRRLRAAVADLKPRAAGTDLAQALRLVAAVAGGRDPEVHVFSDGGGRAPGDVPFPGTLAYHPLGGAPPNLGIVATELTPLGGKGPATHELYARVLNAGPERDAFLGLVARERLIAARAIHLAEGQTQATTFSVALPPGIVELRLLEDAEATPLRDGLAADDRVWLRVTRSRSVRCALSSPTPRPWVERGLLASGADLVAAGEASDLRVTVGAEPGSGRGDALTFAPPAAVGPVGLGPALVEPRVVAWDREHPLLAHVELGDLLLGAARGLVLGSSADPLVFARPAAGGEAVPIAAAFRADGGLHVVVGFDPDESSWPRQLSFPIFLRNVVRAAEERLEGSEPSALRAGGPVSVPLQDAEVVTLTLPDGAQRSLPVVDGRAVFDSRQGVGVYRLRTPSAERLVCVNLLDPQESQLAAPPTLDVGARPISVETSSHARREVTWWFALVACGLLCVEVWAYHRRW